MQPYASIAPEATNSQYRARIIGLCARATEEELERALAHFPQTAKHDELRPPETGLVMLRGRIGGTGNAFNIGEATVTRAVVRIEGGATGFGYVMGRSHSRARKAALVDALAQNATHRATVEAEFAAMVQRRLEEVARSRSEKAAATKVDFFTLVRGED